MKERQKERPLESVQFHSQVYCAYVCMHVHTMHATHPAMPLIQMARSLVMKPASMVSTQTTSRASANTRSSALSSSFARCSSPRDHAKMDAAHTRPQHIRDIFSQVLLLPLFLLAGTFRSKNSEKEEARLEVFRAGIISHRKENRTYCISMCYLPMGLVEVSLPCWCCLQCRVTVPWAASDSTVRPSGQMSTLVIIPRDPQPGGHTNTLNTSVAKCLTANGS